MRAAPRTPRLWAGPEPVARAARGKWRRRWRVLLPFGGPSARASVPGGEGGGAGRQPRLGRPSFPQLPRGGSRKLGSPSGLQASPPAPRPQVRPPGSRPACPRPARAADIAGCWLRWELCGGPLAGGAGYRPGSLRFPGKAARRPAGRTLGGGGEPGRSGSDRG